MARLCALISPCFTLTRQFLVSLDRDENIERVSRGFAVELLCADGDTGFTGGAGHACVRALSCDEAPGLNSTSSGTAVMRYRFYFFDRDQKIG